MMESKIESSRWPSFNMDNIEALHQHGIDVWHNYFAGGDIASLEIGAVRLGMLYNDFEDIDAWVHEFTEFTLIDILFSDGLNNHTIMFDAYEDQFKLTVSHIMTSLISSQHFITRGRKIKTCPDEFSQLLFK